MEKKKVWIVEHNEYGVASNWSTGTRVFTRKHNAINLMRQKNGGRDCGYSVVEYDLTPTGATVSFAEDTR